MKPTIIYDDNCGVCLCFRRALEPLDLLHTMEWLPLQDPSAERFGVARHELERHVYFVSGTRRWSGFSAVKQVLLRLPPLYAAAGALVAKYPKSALGILLFFSPPAQPVGDAVYDWVARNRHRMPTCSRAV